MQVSKPIDAPGDLPGEKIYDQEELEIGTIKQVYESEEGGAMWVSIEASFGMGDKRIVYAPIARLKHEGDRLRLPYSKGHMESCPEIESDDEISGEDDATLRDHYGIDRADQELRSDNESYATRVPAERGTSSSVSDNPESLNTEDSDSGEERSRDDDAQARSHRDDEDEDEDEEKDQQDN